MTGENIVNLARLLSPIFGILSAIALIKWKKVTVPGLCVLAMYCLQTGTIDTFIAAGMPEAPTYLLMIVALASNSTILAVSSLVIGVIRPSTLILLGIFELVRGLYNKKFNRFWLIFIGIVPSLIWYQILPVNLSIPSWGFGADLAYLGTRINFWSIPISILGIGITIETFWTLIFILMTQFSFLPRRFIYPLILSGSLMAENGIKKIKGKFVQFSILIILILILINGSWSFWTKFEPNLKYQDLDTMYWLKENLVSGVVAHRDLSTIWVLYYAQKPTLLDGYSEGLDDAQERMDDVLGALESDKLEKTREVGAKYNMRYITYNLAENWTFKANIEKYKPWTTLTENWYSTVKMIM
jgi:hypothetical protein